MFDFESAAQGHPLDDFKYLPGFGLPFMEALLASHTAHGGQSLELTNIWRAHAYSALEHLNESLPALGATAASSSGHVPRFVFRDFGSRPSDCHPCL